MKKKKLLKRIEELETSLQSERKKYRELLFEDDKLTIEVKRLEYKIKEDIEHCFFFGLASGITEFKTPEFKRHSFDLIDKDWLGLKSNLETNKYNYDPTFNVLKYWSNDISYGYMWDNYEIPRIKYCKTCTYPILRLNKLVTVLKNGERVFDYGK